jgi:hypothetical protein
MRVRDNFAAQSPGEAASSVATFYILDRRNRPATEASDEMAVGFDHERVALVRGSNGPIVAIVNIVSRPPASP